jgi:hypothetical protein
MADFFLEESFDPPLAGASERTMMRALDSCLRHGDWRECFLDRDRRRMLCRFEALDAHALYRASPCASFASGALWAGTIYSPPPAGRDGHGSHDRLSDLIGEKDFDAPMPQSDLVELARSCTWCFEFHRVQLVRLFLSHNGRRAIALFRAPDAESVRLAYQRAGTPLDRVWRCRRIGSGDRTRIENTAAAPG